MASIEPPPALRRWTTPAPIEFFVCGKPKKGDAYVIVRYEKVDKGWESRVVLGKAPELNNVYVSDETREELAAWHPCDFVTKSYITNTLSAAKEHVARKSDQVLL